MGRVLLLSQVKAAEMGFFSKSSRHVSSQQSAQLWNSQSCECRTTSPEREISATAVRSRDRNAPRKIGEASPAGYTHGKAAQRSTEDQVVGLYLLPGLVPSWCGGIRTIWRFVLTVRYFESSRAAVSATLLRGRVGMKRNEKIFLLHCLLSILIGKLYLSFLKRWEWHLYSETNKLVSNPAVKKLSRAKKEPQFKLLREKCCGLSSHCVVCYCKRKQ